MNIKKWFIERGYQLQYNAVEPVYRNKRVYAVASPNGGGGWLSFPNKRAVLEYIQEREKGGG